MHLSRPIPHLLSQPLHLHRLFVCGATPHQLQPLDFTKTTEQSWGSGQLLQHHLFDSAGSGTRARVFYCLVAGEDELLYPVELYWLFCSRGDEIEPYMSDILNNPASCLRYAYRMAAVADQRIPGSEDFYKRAIDLDVEPPLSRLVMNLVRYNYHQNQLTRLLVERELLLEASFAKYGQ